MIRFMDIAQFIKPYRIEDGRKFKLSQINPADTHHIKNKDRAKELLAEGVEKLAELQEKLYAQNCWALLLIFQAMDAAGKDSTIKHVMSGVNPQGCQVYSFKAPSSQELDHDFMWRSNLCLPERGRIGIFNRSYYEEVLVVRVHPEYLERQHLPPDLISKKIWEQRYQDINSYERYLTRNGIAIRKFFLHVSKKEQKRRFLDRLNRPEKNWKFEGADVGERSHWGEYQRAYQDMIRNTASKHAPWFVVPADHKWFTRLVVAAAVVDAMDELKPVFPKLNAAKRKELAKSKRLLEAE
jgi:PPK2 family polyphosphate:nucleotide phosphotransferase